MSKSFVSPYGITLKEDGQLETIPLVKIQFLNKKNEWLSLFLIVDSGATISALPKADALSFGIDLEKGKQIVISGISNEKLIGWQHQIAIRIENEIFQLPIVFLDVSNAPRIFGRAGIFENFILIFEEKKQRVGFIGKDQQEAKTIQKILDKISNV